MHKAMFGQALLREDATSITVGVGSFRFPAPLECPSSHYFTTALSPTVCRRILSVPAKSHTGCFLSTNALYHMPD